MRVWKAMGEGRQKQRRLERWTGARPHGPCGWQRVGILFAVRWELQEELSKLGTSSALN